MRRRIHASKPTSMGLTVQEERPVTEDDGHQRKNDVPPLRPHRHPEPENEMRLGSLESNVGDLRPKREIDAGQTDGQVTRPLDRASVSVIPSVRGASAHRVEHIQRLTVNLPVKMNACMSMEVRSSDDDLVRPRDIQCNCAGGHGHQPSKQQRRNVHSHSNEREEETIAI